MCLLIIWEKVIVFDCCKYTSNLHDSRQQMSRQETSTELSCGLWCNPINKTIQIDIFNVILLLITLVFLKALRVRHFYSLHISSLFEGSLMHDCLDVIYGEWLPRVSELERLMIDNDLHLDLALNGCTGIFRVLQKFPDPPFGGSRIVLVVESIQTIYYLVCKLIC